MASPPFTLFIVYHKVLYKENIEGFSEELLNHLTWVAVNEEIEKEYPDYTKKRLIKEWEMKEYSPMYQMLHWQQNSFLHHLYFNKECMKTKYVGFAQYDQKLKAEEFIKLSKSLENDKANKLIGCFPYTFEHCCDVLSPSEWKTHFLDFYNEYYNQNHTMEELYGLPMFLLHTFIIPRWYYEYMMPFIEVITPKIVRVLGWKIRHLAGTLERVYALFLACGMLEGKFREVLIFDGIKQNDEQRTSDPIRGVNGV